MIPEVGQLWMEDHNGLFFVTDIVQYGNNVHLYKLYSFRDSCMYDWTNPFSDSVPSNFQILD